MDKRFLTFCAGTAAIFLTYFAVSQFFAGNEPAEPAADVAAADATAVGADAAPSVDGEPEPPADGGAADGNEPPADDPKPGEDKPETEEPEAAKKLEQKWVAIGSIDPDLEKNPYRLLATFNTKGGTVERIELANPRYRDLQLKHGYIGSLALTATKDGALIHVTGDGTPAKDAGLKPGDLIQEVNGAAVKTPLEFRGAMEDTQPGDVIKLKVKSKEGKASTVEMLAIRRPVSILRPEPYVDAAPRADWLPLSYRMTLMGDKSTKAGTVSSMLTGNWELDEEETTGDTVVFRRLLTEKESADAGLSGKWEVAKRFSLTKAAGAEEAEATAAEAPTDGSTVIPQTGYHLNLEIEITNRSEKEQSVRYALYGPQGLPSEGWWFLNKISPSIWGGAGARDIVWKTVANGHTLLGCSTIYKNAWNAPGDNQLFKATSNPADRDNSTVNYVAVDTQYFASAILPATGDKMKPGQLSAAYALVLGEATKEGASRAKAANTSFRLESMAAKVKPEASMKQSFVLFAGPKEPPLVDEYGLGETVYYGWFGIVSKPLVQILDIFYWITGSYGLSIILLTICVRGCMFPLSRKAARNAQMMQHLAPQMKEIREKYKNDMEKQQQAQKELFARHNYNPFGGCLLMFVQLPIFLGLYRGLSVDIALRDRPLIPGMPWCSNLAAPDQLIYWGTSPEYFLSETGWLGPYLNILPLVTVCLFLVQQKLFTPPATDEQTKMQQQMMSFMTLFIGLMFFKVPAGLCIYFITSSLWGICERKLIPKPEIKEAPNDRIRKGPSPGGGGGKPKDKNRDKRRSKKKR